LTWHQTDYPPGFVQIRTQQRNGKSKSRDCLSFGFRPKSDNLVAHCTLCRSAKAGAIVEVPQVNNIEMP